MEQLRTKLSSSQPETYNHRVALYGMGGVGKTQVATEYVFKYRAHYRSVFWLSAATQADLQIGFQQIAKEVHCANDTEKDADAVAKAVLQWLKHKSSWLLVIDNLDTISVVHGYLPELNGDDCHVLITTRNRDATGIPAQGLEVEVFDSSHAVDLLLLRSSGTKQSQPEIRSQATEIVKELGCLALAIEHAAAFIRQSSTLSQFMDMYSKSRKEFLEHLPTQNHTYPRAIAATLLMSFNKVEEDNEDAAKLLILFSFLNPDGILLDFLQDGHKGIKEPLRSLISTPFKFGKALGKLGEFSLIRQSNDGRTIAIHRLVQTVIKDHIGHDLAREFAGLAISLCLMAFPRFAEDHRQLCRRYQTQVDGPVQSLFHLNTEEIAAMSLRLALFLDADGKTSVAEQFERVAVKVRTELFGTDDPRTLTAMNNLAATYQSLGQAQEAAELHKKVLEASQRKLGMEHPNTLTSMNNLAEMYRSLGQPQEAAELHKKVLETRQRKLGMEHPNTLTSIFNLAYTYWASFHREEAISLYEAELTGCRKCYGDLHQETVNSRKNLIAKYREVGRLEEANRLEEEL